MKSCSIRNFNRLFFIMMVQEKTNVKECYQGKAIFQPNKLNAEGRAQYVSVPMCDNARNNKIKNKANICLQFQKMKSY